MDRKRRVTERGGGGKKKEKKRWDREYPNISNINIIYRGHPVSRKEHRFRNS